MPYKSLAQERFFHSKSAKKKGITPKMVEEFDKATKGRRLPKRVSKQKNPGDMFNAYQAKKKLRTSDAVVKSEQNASHQFKK